jgi:hypothetical protein
MSYLIRCHTLFDITNTGVLNRRPPSFLEGEKLSEWNENKKRQCNFDTVLQVVSLRSQPENISKPYVSTITFEEFEKFGFLLETSEDQPIPKWAFEFTVNYHGVFNDGISELGALYSDCDSVPMITGLGEWSKLPNFLDISPELKNIYFEVL